MVTWGNPDAGGSSRKVQGLLKGVKQIQATENAFAALLSDGRVVTWGDRNFGGDSRSVQQQLKGVQHIQATAYTFAAVLGDGSVVPWSDENLGGDRRSVRHLKTVCQIQAATKDDMKTMITASFVFVSSVTLVSPMPSTPSPAPEL